MTTEPRSMDLLSLIFAKNGLSDHEFYKGYNKIYLEMDRQLYRNLKIEFDSKKRMYNIWEPLKIKPLNLMKRELGIRLD